MFTNLKKFFHQQIKRYISNKITHHNLNAWLYYCIIYHKSQIHISDCRQFSDIHISQRSVATYLRCGGILKYEFVANLPPSLPASERIWKIGEYLGTSWARV